MFETYLKYLTATSADEQKSRMETFSYKLTQVHLEK